MTQDNDTPRGEVSPLASAHPRKSLLADYEAIEDAVRETPRGRAFLEEFARRSRADETAQILHAIARLEDTIKAQALSLLRHESAHPAPSESAANCPALPDYGLLLANFANGVAECAHKLKARGDALDLAEKLGAMAGAVLSHIEKSAPMGSPQEATHFEGETDRAPTRAAPKNGKDPGISAQAIALAKTPEAGAPRLTPELPRTALQAELPPPPMREKAVQAKNVALFLPAMEVTEFDDDGTTAHPEPSLQKTPHANGFDGINQNLSPSPQDKAKSLPYQAFPKVKAAKEKEMARTPADDAMANEPPASKVSSNVVLREEILEPNFDEPDEPQALLAHFEILSLHQLEALAKTHEASHLSLFC